MTKLSVNINKIAWLRNGRGGDVPNLVQMAQDIERFGADGITVHPRPDERHITTNDVYEVAKIVTTEYNIEGYPNERFLKICSDIKPTQATLVPDPPNVLTSNAGWNTKENFSFLKEVVSELKKYRCRVSLFIENNLEYIELAKKLGADRVELYTGSYAKNFNTNKEEAIKKYKKAAIFINEIGLGINAGHDLDLNNLHYFKNNIPNLLEVSIGHALISDSLYFGIENTINLYKRQLSQA